MKVEQIKISDEVRLQVVCPLDEALAMDRNGRNLEEVLRSKALAMTVSDRKALGWRGLGCYTFFNPDDEFVIVFQEPLEDDEVPEERPIPPEEDLE